MNAQDNDVLTCRQAVSLMMDCVGGLSQSQGSTTVKRHLEHCRECSALFNTYSKTVRAVRSLRYPDITRESVRRVRCFIESRIKGPAFCL